jgi:hypothetical protein
LIAWPNSIWTQTLLWSINHSFAITLAQRHLNSGGAIPTEADQGRLSMPTKTKATKKKAAKKTATKKKASTSDAMTITLSADQQAQLKKLSGGAIDVRTIKLRPNLDVTDFLARLLKLRPVKSGGIAPPPKDTYWV